MSGGPENPLEKFFRESTTARLMHKWPHYFKVYDRHLSQYRGRDITVVEFGVYHGGSLQMWQEYFGPGARIVGVDIDPRTLTLRELGLDVRLGDQADREFLRQLREELGPIDVVIDDGGHRMDQQINTVEELFPFQPADGVMLVEDVHTSYWPEYGGGMGKPDSFIEWSKQRLDDVNFWHQRQPEGTVPGIWTTHLDSIHVYDSIVVLERGSHAEPPPAPVRSGIPSFED